MNDLLVSISCITYNHEPYIRKCLDGFLLQQTNFSYEILIHDDASTDETANIIKEYEEKYPNIVKPIYQTQNQYSKGVKGISIVYNFVRAKGLYIAMCDGDDYWTDPYKLQKQVDFLQKNTDYQLVYHKVNIYDEVQNKLNIEENNVLNQEKTYTIEDLAKRNFIHTPSVLFRKDNLDFSPFLKSKIVPLDYSLWVFCAAHGKIKYLPDIMAVYRIWNGSVWEKKSVVYKTKIWIEVIISLLMEYGDNVNIHAGLFQQLNQNYRTIYDNSETSSDYEELDYLTKKLLVQFIDFREWWFSYVMHIKRDKKYKLKYLIYLMKNNKKVSIRAIKNAFL